MDPRQEDRALVLLGKLVADMDTLKRAVLGNGQPGLLQKVEDLEASKNRVWGIGAAVTFIGGLAEWLIHRK